MTFSEWVKKWNIPPAAVDDYCRMVGIHDSSRDVSNTGSEASIQALVRMEASGKGCRLWRNNVGATYTPDGSFIRYGLANESSRMNQTIKSADLIGIRPVKVTLDHVGCVIGQFVSREIKAPNWKYTGTPREVAQLQWAELILSLGGDACFANNEGTL